MRIAITCRTWIVASMAVACLHLPAALPAVEDVEKGLYHAVPLKPRERHLIETAGEYEDLFVRRGYRYPSPDLEGLLRRIGTGLAPEPADPYVRYRFYLVADPFPRAFALPDGQIYVSTGMLSILENRAQVAATLARQITHTEGHHGLVSFRQTRARAISSMVVGPLTLGVSDYFLMRGLCGYSRTLEREADERGLRRMLDHGWDGREMARLFEILDRGVEGEEVEKKPDWRTKPELAARARESAARIADMSPPIDFATLRRGDQGFFELTRSVALESVQAFIRQDYPRSAADLAGRLIERHAGDAPAYCALGDALYALGARPQTIEWTRKGKKQDLRQRAELTREERARERRDSVAGQATLQRNLEASRQAYLQALDLEPGLAEAHRGLGYVLAELGSGFEAGKEMVTYVRLRPQAPDKPIVLERLNEILAALKRKEKVDESQY